MSHTHIGKIGTPSAFFGIAAVKPRRGDKMRSGDFRSSQFSAAGTVKNAGKAVSRRVEESVERTDKTLNRDSRYKKNAEKLVK